MVAIACQEGEGLSALLHLDQLGFQALFVLDEFSHLAGMRFHGFSHEVGCVERKERLSVIAFRVALRQQKGFGGFAVGLHASEIEVAVQSVVSPAGEEKPLTVCRPVVKTVGPPAIRIVKWMAFSGRQVSGCQMEK